MRDKLNSIYEVLGKWREYINKHQDNQFWAYSNPRKFGSLLVKNKVNGERILFKPWNTQASIGMRKIQKFVIQHPKFKGHKVNNYVFIGRNFRYNSKRYLEVEDSITLIEADIENNKINMFGSNNIDITLMKILIKFADSILFETRYDFEGVLLHQGFKKGVQQVDMVEKKKTPTVFISYSWDNEKHKLWVLKLSSDLLKNGINVIIDEWNLGEYHNDLHYFMETGIRESDHVIMVCTPIYAKKANIRIGGVGIENTIITGEFYDESKVGKYIPLVKNYDKNVTESLPSYLKTKYAIDFKEESKYEQKFEELLRRILNIPKYERPELGKIPNLKTKPI